ncbi:MAG TPA: helix-turn-helix domain-containing protein, partial [Planctomycetota bacterium]|nr:helix-turn-helix domain-containing protein [Planctomycetota bacterium]
EISAVDLGLASSQPTAAPALSMSDEVDLDRKVAELEISYIREALQRAKGNYTKAAQSLRMSLRSFRYKLQKYGLDKDA